MRGGNKKRIACAAHQRALFAKTKGRHIRDTTDIFIIALYQ